MNLKCGLQRILKNLALILFGTNQIKLPYVVRLSFSDPIARQILDLIYSPKII